jgi:hypothetical protein
MALTFSTTGTTPDLMVQVYDVSQAPAAVAPATGETSQDDLMQVQVLVSPDGRLTGVQPVDWNRG